MGTAESGARKPVYSADWDTPRVRRLNTLFYEDAEGLHPRVFCVIPYMRAPRLPHDWSVVAEVRQLVAEGVKEILISQDTIILEWTLGGEGVPSAACGFLKGERLSHY